MSEEKAKVTLDDKEYIVEDLSDRARYCVVQIQDLQKQASQLEMASNGFLDALRVAIAETNKEQKKGA